MFRFTIRDVLWLTVVVAVCCAWWLNRSRLITARQSAVDAQAKAESVTKEVQNAISELYAALHRRGLSTRGEFLKKVEVVGPFNNAPQGSPNGEIGK